MKRWRVRIRGIRERFWERKRERGEHWGGSEEEKKRKNERKEKKERKKEKERKREWKKIVKTLKKKFESVIEKKLA